MDAALPPDVRKGFAFPAYPLCVAARLRLADAGEGARVPSMRDRRIVILGFMGCGKTTVGQTLARELNCNFVDLDSFIAEREGRSAAEIIKADGEASFREIETLALRQVLEDLDARVIALGGGAWTVPANRTLVGLHDCLSVWLDAPFELCWKRIARSTKTVRPMAPDPETAKKRFDGRRADYALAEQHISLRESDRAGKIVEQILRQSGHEPPPIVLWYET